MYSIYGTYMYYDVTFMDYDVSTKENMACFHSVAIINNIL